MSVPMETKFYYSPSRGRITWREPGEDRYPLTDPDDWRPLATIQLERHQAAFVIGALERVGHSWTNKVADALRVLAASPEPGTWGVVEAACVHSDKRREWMHHPDGNWYVVGEDTKNNPDDWDSLVDPVVVREGVSA